MVKLQSQILQKKLQKQLQNLFYKKCQKKLQKPQKKLQKKLEKIKTLGVLELFSLELLAKKASIYLGLNYQKATKIATKNSYKTFSIKNVKKNFNSNFINSKKTYSKNLAQKVKKAIFSILKSQNIN